MEIEKKYRVKELPENYRDYPCRRIEQAYLCEDPVVRIRKSNEDYILTYKSKIGLKKNTGRKARVNNEVEVPLNSKGYEHLKEKADGNLIRKSRYIIPLQKELKAELDIFEGCLTGLMVVEVEFATEEEAAGFVPPFWFGEDVTFDKRYVNKNLIYVNSLEELENSTEMWENRENKREMYETLHAQLKSLIEDEDDKISNLSNASALLMSTLKDINWAGFYLRKEGRLQLGPFQGKVACIRIPMGKGVCGTAAAEDKIQRIGDVHQFPGHIACDSASNSEIVIPLHDNGEVVGVLDIDSPVFERFTEEDQEGLEKAARILEQGCEW